MSHSALRKVPHVVGTERLILVSWLGRTGSQAQLAALLPKPVPPTLNIELGRMKTWPLLHVLPRPQHLSKPQAHKSGGQKEHQPPSTVST